VNFSGVAQRYQCFRRARGYYFRLRIVFPCFLHPVGGAGVSIALVSARDAPGAGKMGERRPWRSSTAPGSAADADSSGDRACSADPQGFVFLSGDRAAAGCLQPHAGHQLGFSGSHPFCRGVFRARPAFHLGGVISALLELRESLEQVELEGRFVFHAVEPSLSDERQDSGEIFTDTSS